MAHRGGCVLKRLKKCTAVCAKGHARKKNAGQKIRKHGTQKVIYTIRKPK